MYTVLPALIILVILIVILRILYLCSPIIKFYATGLDSGFKIKEIGLLWKLANDVGMEEPYSLFWSVPALNRSIATIIKTARIKGKENSKETQFFLERLYKYRTKVELDPKNNKSLKTTKGLEPGQRIRIVLKGHGVFSATILGNGRELIISMPVQSKMVLLKGSEWIGKDVNIYFRRYGDASYVFDSTVRDSAVYNSTSVLYLAHSENLVRTQKRKSVRCECSVYGSIYIVNSETVDLRVLETEPGYKCLIEDISEDGALVRIGGQGRPGLQMKLQFILDTSNILMFGVVKAVEYNKSLNQSRMHFECIEIDSYMKNSILSYVYKVMPQEEIDIITAMAEADKDAEIPPELEELQEVEEHNENNI